ncbi:MAG: tyrosine-type recombinase/integrase [Actinomycetota bacterium]
MSRRGRREGSLYRRDSDGRWVGAITLEDGRRRVVYGRTQAEARARLRDLQRAVEDGRIILAGRDITLARYLERWLAETLPPRVAAGRLKERTLDSYQDMVRLHITPGLGDVPLVRLKPAQVRRWVAEKVTAGGLSARTIAYAHAVLRKALADALRDDLVGRNVAAVVQAPTGAAKTREPLTVAETRRLMRAAAGDRLAILWLLLVALGLRVGEALALRWDDLNLDEGTVTITRTVSRLRDAPDASGKRRSRIIETRPKTTAAAATIALPAVLVAALRKHQARQKRDRMKAPVWVRPDLVVTTHLGTQLEPKSAHRAWVALCDRAGVRRTRVHDLRHASATFMLGAGVDLKVVQATLRHTKLATTADIYAHVIAEVQRGAADRMDGILAGIVGE